VLELLDLRERRERLEPRRLEIDPHVSDTVRDIVRRVRDEGDDALLDLALRFDGADRARPAPGVLEALRSADAIVICPANPILSIAPILAVPGIRDTVAAHGRVVGISNLIAGAAVRGPADRLLADLGIEASCVGVARGYRDLCAAFVIDDQDAARASEVEALGVRAVVTDTLMKDPEVAASLARETLAAVA